MGSCRLVALALPALALPLSSQTLVARINAGGPAVVDALGATWTADAPYVPGGAGYEGGLSLTNLSRPDGILQGGYGNPLKAMYAKARVGWTHYRVDVPDGDYLVRLSLAEIWNQGPELRVMDVSVEGVPLLTDHDCARELGVQYGGQVATLVHVSDGTLDIAATGGPGEPEVAGSILCGLEVWSAPPVLATPAMPTGLEARPSYGANLVTWNWDASPGLAGWRVYAQDAAPIPHVARVPHEPEWTALVDLPAAPPRLIDRSAIPGRRRAYRVAALGLDGSEGPWSPAASARALDGADSDLPRLEIAIDPADWSFLDQAIFLLPDEEVPAVLTTAGTTRPAEVRYRGGASRSLSKKSWKIKLSADEVLDGRRDLNLKASFLDPGLIREAMAHELFTAVGQVSSAITPMHLEVNGTYLGVFNEAEDVDEAWLSIRERPVDGDLFKVDSDLKPLPDLAAYQILYEKETNEATGHDSLIALVEFLNAPPSATFLVDLVDRFDVESYLTYLAVVAWIGDRDSIWHNYYLYENLELGRWELFPWDNDVSFALAANQLFVSILLGTDAVPGQVNQLRQRVLDEPTLLWRFCSKLTELEQRFANEDWLAPRIEAAAALRARGARTDPFKFGWESDVPHELDLDTMRTYAALRTPIVDAQVAAVQPSTPPTVVWINELVAEAQTQVADEQGEFEDWVELSNAAATPMDLGGLFLTDDLSDPMRFALPPGTVVSAGGRLLVWCDGEPADGPLHAPFTLGEAGGELGLFASDGATLLDFVAWNRQYPGLSYGRSSDAGAFFEVLPTPTPAAANTTAGNLPPTLSWITADPVVPGSGDPLAITCRSTDADGLLAVELHWRTAPGAYTTVTMDPLGADRFTATVPAQADGTSIEYWLSSTDLAGRTSTRPAAGPDDPFVVVVVDSAFDFLRITELMASNSSTIADEFGEFEDWIELHNASASPFDVSGMFLTDNLSNSTRWEIPAGTIVPAGGRLLFWADSDPAQGPRHTSFGLSGSGEAVGLFDTLAGGNALIDGYTYPAQTADQSHGRLTEDGLRFRFPAPTPGAANLPAPGQARVYRHGDPSVHAVHVTNSAPVQVGGALTVDVADAPPGQPGELFLSLAPADLAGPGGVALVAQPPVASLVFAVGGAGTAAVAFPIPSDPGLVNVQIFAQVLVAGGGLSDALVATIGP